MKSKLTNKPTSPEIIARIREMRSIGIPVAEVAQRLQVDGATVSKYAKGMHKKY